MRLGRYAGVTDTGRKRRRNEDAYVIRPPLFAVADGMGGAQAGEVASRLAAAVFREFEAEGDESGEGRVAALIQEANRRIYERARADAEVSGMGTTLTAALVGGGRVSVGHVGDSRAYRLRAGRFEQLTRDHSLVADLVRSGRLAPEDADAHPQRSVITRALGTDPEVDVDTFSVDAEPGDLYLLCSDGLTTMVTDEEIRELVERAGGLEEAGKALVKAANRQGGEDNVTVVLFALAEGGDELEDTDTIVPAADGQAPEGDLEDTLSGLETESRQQASTAATAELAPEPVGWPEELGEPGRSEPPPEPPRRGWGRRILISLVTLTLLLGLVAVALWGLSRAHFVGADEEGRVAVYQGVPWELGGGIDLYRVRYVSELQAVQLSAEERARLFDHSLVSFAEARELIAGYEDEGVP